MILLSTILMSYELEVVHGKNNERSLTEGTNVPDCVNEAFPNRTNTATKVTYDDILRIGSYPNYEPRPIVCKLCLKVMEEIDSILTDPDIEDGVSYAPLSGILSSYILL